MKSSTSTIVEMIGDGLFVGETAPHREKLHRNVFGQIGKQRLSIAPCGLAETTVQSEIDRVITGKRHRLRLG